MTESSKSSKGIALNPDKTVPETSTIFRELDKARKKLLDLTARNRLLNIPQGKSSKSISVVDEISVEVFEMLVRQGKRFSFSEASADQAAADGEVEGGFLPLPIDEDDDDSDERGVASRHRDTQLQTALKAEVLQRRLLSIYYDARTAIEEQGVNTLFLALGQLKWREDRSSAVDRFAPLMLIPVELERGTAKERFKLKLLDQDPSENLSLVEKLKEFGIIAPPFEYGDDFSLSAYFDDFSEVISKQEGWEVFPNKISLGFFSFAKFLMYRDLDPDNWPEEAGISDHPLVAGLMGEGFAPTKSAIPPDGVLDKLIPVERLNHVVDSDSSQAIAIEEVRAGRHLVIQGPPGTGKSQTITNLIATAVLDGKRVLFVAEKLAALEVVKKRLDKYGLGSIALELHSHKSNKRSVLEEIRQTLEQGRPVVQGAHSVMDDLRAHREALNRHAETLNRPWGAAERSAIHVIGKLTLLDGAVETARLPQVEGAVSWTRAEVKERRQVIQDLVPLLDEIGKVNSHPWRGVTRTVLSKIDAETISELVKKTVSLMKSLREQSSKLAGLLTLGTAESLAAVEQHVTIAELLGKAPPLDPVSIAHEDWIDRQPRVAALVEAGRRFAAIRAGEGSRFIDSAWSIDLNHTRLQIAAHGQSVLRILNRKYRDAFAEFKALLADPSPPKDHATRLRWIDSLIEGQKLQRQIQEGSELGTHCFGKSFWDGESSQWERLSEIVSWRSLCEERGLGHELFETLAGIKSFESCAKEGATLKTTLDELLERLSALIKELSFDAGVAFGESDLVLVDLATLDLRLQGWMKDPESLHLWVTLRHRLKLLRDLGIEDLTGRILDSSLSSHELLNAFDIAYYRQLYQQLIHDHPDLATFDGLSHERLVESFRAADRKRIEFARYEVLTRHQDSVDATGGGMGAVGILKGEMARKRGHMPIRKLLEKAGSAAQAIKPVFMMSPMSVAQFLAPGAVEFDLVVFDEASQVEPVDAMGAIARGRQLVVVGDERQLPPTNFFSKMGLEDEEEEDDDIVSAGDIESILGLANAKGLPSSMLRWHYRSRHQSLISVSNHEFYENKLFIVPSPHRHNEELGLKFHYITDGYFDRGKTRKNVGEAKAIAEAVIRHAREYPGKSLGVGAFSVSQRDAILDEVEMLRRKNSDVETFFATHPGEPFFVKNLENIQGDERDVIFISVGYGKDAAGNRYMHFGPINNEGGERRLNVLISRAKERCEVFSSIHADEIDAAGKGRGLKAFKTFLHFAETGILGVPDGDTGREPDSAFEEAVIRAIRAEGYEVHPQVGSAGFFVDLAVVHPKIPGRYVLGVECDGATYHSARSARERDRQRQSILVDHGWKIHRIWSTDWFNRPGDQLARTIEAIENAIACNGAGPAEVAPLASTLTIERLQSGPVEAEQGPSGVLYVEADHFVATHLDIHEVDIPWMADLVTFIVGVQSPIHREEIVTRVREFWGVGRAGSRIQSTVNTAIDFAVAQGKVITDRSIVLLPGGTVTIRDRSEVKSTSLKKPDYLPPQEIQTGILQLVKASHGVESAELAVGIARLLGFKSTSKQFREIVQREVDLLCEEGGLLKTNNFLKIPA